MRLHTPGALVTLRLISHLGLASAWLVACAPHVGTRAPSHAASRGAEEKPPPSFWVESLRELDKEPAAALSRWDERLDGLRERLVYDRGVGELVLGPPHKPPGEAPLVARPEEQRGAEVDYVATPSGRRVREHDYLASGGIYKWLTLQPGLPGHYEVTLALLVELDEPTLQLGREAALIVADAARDPDFFAWGTAAAHAQTPHDDLGRPTLSTEAAMEAFISWVVEHTQAAKRACGAGKARLALHELGMALHAVEDLAAHDGRTNAEHAWNAALGEDPDDPDDIEGLMARARALARNYWENAGRKALAACGGHGQLKLPGQPWSWQEKTGELGLKRDLSVGSYCAYVEFGLGVKKPWRYRLRCGRAPRTDLKGAYPVVRWSEKRSFEQLLEAIAARLQSGVGASSCSL
jgi:hypothetical protein